MLSPLILSALADWLGFGGQVGLAILLSGLALWGVKALRIGRTMGSMVASAVRTGIVVLVFLAVGTALGFLDISPSVFFELVGGVWSFLAGLVGRFGDDIMRVVT